MALADLVALFKKPSGNNDSNTSSGDTSSDNNTARPNTSTTSNAPQNANASDEPKNSLQRSLGETNAEPDKTKDARTIEQKLNDARKEGTGLGLTGDALENFTATKANNAEKSSVEIVQKVAGPEAAMAAVQAMKEALQNTFMNNKVQEHGGQSYSNLASNVSGNLNAGKAADVSLANHA